ncbi:DUF3006 domain-containing protein [Methanoculleus sp. FWC-SCC3]|uniref:DUF3006 domain-containing protein n=1 Tax=Methanoculleus methanifontis TaxID=2584086 RepID=A0ABT8M4I9_9EURY|nr:DUF3006 domain-containing protein [Methanoculleus sp. FWC-SCC3]MDN7013506.1 DUF3006 domain-containing protein [Methanoculleus sp. FWC-SCC3]
MMAEDESAFRVSLDRVEEGLAVLLLREDESIRFTLPRSLLPPGAREGDILEVAIRRDVAETEAARRRVAERIERLRKRSAE